MGFQIFDNIHLFWLFLIIVFIVFYIKIFTSLEDKKQRNLEKIIFVILLSFEVVKQIYLLTTNQYTYWSLPLHLCGLGIFITGWHAYWPGRIPATILYALTLPGAGIALIFPGWTVEPVWSFLHIHSFVFHALLVANVCALIVCKKLYLRVIDLWSAVVFLLVTVPPIYFYNQHFKTNFMFLNRPIKGTPLQWIYDIAGASGYLVGLACILCCIWLLLYSPILIKRRGIR